jgi:hypothetical protein
LFVMAVLIAIATVYGRYHYLADATCGAVIACIVPVLVPARRPNAQSLGPDSIVDTSRRQGQRQHFQALAGTRCRNKLTHLMPFQAITAACLKSDANVSTYDHSQ